MKKTVQLVVAILLFVACLRLSICDTTGGNGQVLFTYVPDNCFSTVDKLASEAEWKDNPSLRVIDYLDTYWKHYPATDAGGVCIIDSYEQLIRVADRIKTTIDYCSWDMNRGASGSLKATLLQLFPTRYFENHIIVVLSGISYVPKTYIRNIVVKEGRLQVSVYSRYLESWVSILTEDIIEGEQLILISMRRPEQEINSALVLVEAMPEEWDATGPEAGFINLRWATQEELFPNLRHNGK